MKRVLTYRLVSNNRVVFKCTKFNTMHELESAVQDLKKNAESNNSTIEYINYWAP